jgi:hypothetical protein
VASHSLAATFKYYIVWCILISKIHSFVKAETTSLGLLLVGGKIK